MGLVRRCTNIWYKNQVHSTTSCTAMELVLSRSHPHLAMEQFGPALEEARNARSKWLSLFGSHMGRIRLALNKAHKRYKNKFYQRLHRRRKDITSGGYAFLRVENSSGKAIHHHKIYRVLDVTFPIMRLGEQTIIVQIPSGVREKVSIDRA